MLSLTGSVFSIKSHCSKVNTIHPEVIQVGYQLFIKVFNDSLYLGWKCDYVR